MIQNYKVKFEPWFLYSSCDKLFMFLYFVIIAMKHTVKIAVDL